MTFFTSSFNKGLSTVSKLKRLKRLEFSCGREDITSLIHLLAVRNTMEHLTIFEAKLNENLCVALSRLKNLKTLKLILMQNECNNFGKIFSKHLSQLKQLYIAYSDLFRLKDALEYIESAPNLVRLVIKECRQFTTIDCNAFSRIVQARKNKCSNNLLTIYLDQSALDASKNSIPDKMFQENSEYIKMVSTLQPEIQNDYFVSDLAKAKLNGSRLSGVRFI